jgi:hypothetical protein
MAPLSRIFESYSSLQRMSVKHLRRFCHDFALNEAHTHAITRSCSQICPNLQDGLSLAQFTEAISVTCSELHVTLGQFLSEIGAKTASSVSAVVESVRERSLLSQRLEQMKQAVCLHVDEWKGRQASKLRMTEQLIQQVLPLSQADSGHSLPKIRDAHPHAKESGHCQLPCSRSALVQLKHPRQMISKSRASGPHHLLPRSDAATLWAEFGCSYSE